MINGAVTVSLQCRAGLGTGVGACVPGSADSVLSWCHPIPGEQGWYGEAVAAHPGSHEKQDNHKLSLHLFPGKGWFVVTSGWLTSPTCVTSCPESSLSSSSAGDRGALLAPQIPPAGAAHARHAGATGSWCSPSTPNWGNPGKLQLGFYKHHAIDLGVLGGWKVQDCALGELHRSRQLAASSTSPSQTPQGTG